MSTFELKKLEQVAQGSIEFYKLLENGKCKFDEFCDQIEKEGNLSGYLDSIYNIMDRVARGEAIADGMIGSIKGGNKNEFEFRKGPLRVYFIKSPEGHIVISGGKKSTQKDKDIPRFQLIHQRFIDFKHEK